MVRDIQHVTVYRDPTGEWNAAFPELAQLANGDLLVSFREARSGPPSAGAGHDHSEPQCRGCLIRSTDGGQSWPPDGRRQLTGTFPMEQCSVSAAGNDLVLFIYALNVLKTPPLTATLQDGSGWSAQRTYIDLARRSRDGGRTWDRATPLTPSPLSHAAIHAPMIELADGTLLAPLCGSLGSDPAAPQQHPQCVVRSHDRRADLGRRLDRGPRPGRPAPVSPGVAGAVARRRDSGGDAQRRDRRPAGRPPGAGSERLAGPLLRRRAHLGRVGVAAVSRDRLRPPAPSGCGTGACCSPGATATSPASGLR